MKKIKTDKIYALLKERAKKVTGKSFITDSDIEKMVGLASGQLHYFKTKERKFMLKKVADKFAAFLNVDVDSFEYRLDKSKQNNKQSKNITSSQCLLNKKMLSVVCLNFMTECRK